MSDNKTGFTPYGLNVLVRKNPNPTQKTSSGLYIPDGKAGEWDSTQHDQGTVIGIGTGIRNWFDNGSSVLQTPAVEIGDYIYFRAGERINLDGTTYYIVHDNAIVGIRDEAVPEGTQPFGDDWDDDDDLDEFVSQDEGYE